jgi:hypothetical protein
VLTPRVLFTKLFQFVCKKQVLNIHDFWVIILYVYYPIRSTSVFTFYHPIYKINVRIYLLYTSISCFLPASDWGSISSPPSPPFIHSEPFFFFFYVPCPVIIICICLYKMKIKTRCILLYRVLRHRQWRPYRLLNASPVNRRRGKGLKKKIKIIITREIRERASCGVFHRRLGRPRYRRRPVQCCILYTFYHQRMHAHRVIIMYTFRLKTTSYVNIRTHYNLGAYRLYTTRGGTVGTNENKKNPLAG